MDGLYRSVVKQVDFDSVPIGKRYLILAPHPDDEVIGCGGTIAKLRAHDNDVKVLYFYECSPNRVCELQEGLEVLDVHEWSVIDDTPAALCNEIRGFKPTSIFLPHIYDRHKDHFKTNMLLGEGLNLSGLQQLEIMEYEVWSTVSANTLINIGDFWNQKVSALHRHKSQIALYDYEDLLGNLSRYRCLMLHPTERSRRLAIYEMRWHKRKGINYTIPWTRAEAFHKFSDDEFLARYKSIKCLNGI